MDTFRLLSRSSNLQRSTSSNSAKVRHVPSTADSRNIESRSNDPDEPGKKRKKRKTQSDNGFHKENNLQHLESSKSSSNTARPIVDHPIVESSKNTDHRLKQISEVKENQRILDLDDRRRTLKQNRIKITTLEAGSLNGKKRKERHELLSGKEEAGYRTEKAHVQLTAQPLRSFAELYPKYNVSRRLATNLDAQGYRLPTKVQLGSLPLLLGDDKDRGLQLDDGNDGLEPVGCSEVDLLTIAPTGSGKTLAFLIHLLHGLRQLRQYQNLERPLESGKKPLQALILAPTHELVDQIVNEGKKLAFGTGFRISRMRKGMDTGSIDSTEEVTPEQQELKASANHVTEEQAPNRSSVKTDILISTPMLLLHAVEPSPNRTAMSLAQVRYLVLDEADVLLDPLFRAQTLGIWDACSNANLRTTLWSATIGSSIESLVQSFILDRRRRLGLDGRRSHHHILRLVVGLKDSAIPNISHQLLYAATERGKLMALRQMIHPSAADVRNERSLQPPFLVFTQTISRAIALHSELLYDIPLEAGGSSRIAVLHSDLSDAARSKIMAGFRKGEIWILVTTDLLARGIDFRGINGVVNYDIPNTSGLYVHRVGRTGRQGREGGVAVTLYTKEDIRYIKNIANVIAASEKQRSKPKDTKGDDELQPWLLNALPDVPKRTRKELKKTGVEARRASTKADDGGKEARRMRISTKSGYDRGLEQKRRAAGASHQYKSAREGSEGDWQGIED
ncbi:MAG: hypothetical protein Q9213_004471 [Squamulea squamosa]